jgi:hypothetical protein
MAENKDLSKAIELLHIGFNVSIDTKKHQDDIETLLETARMFNSTLVLRNLPESMLTEKYLKKLKSHSHKIIIEL